VSRWRQTKGNIVRFQRMYGGVGAVVSRQPSQWLGMHLDAHSLGIRPNGAVGSLWLCDSFYAHQRPASCRRLVCHANVILPCMVHRDSQGNNCGLMRHVDFVLRARRRLGIPTRLIIEFVRDHSRSKERKERLIHYHSCVMCAAVPRPMCTGIWMIRS
jgi:hypothetical protein